jgi:hypothetical protein
LHAYAELTRDFVVILIRRDRAGSSGTGWDGG